MAPLVTVKLPTAEANEMPPASAQAIAVASSVSASPNTAIAVAGEATRRQGRDPSAVMTCPPRSRPKRRSQAGCRHHQHLPARWLRLSLVAHVMPGPFRERYRSAPNPPPGPQSAALYYLARRADVPGR